MIDYLKLLTIALIITIIVEVGIAWLFGLRRKRELATVILINVITNPLLNFLILVNDYFRLVTQYYVLILLLEVFVVLAEWLLLIWVLRLGVKRMLLLSVIMNISSFLAGFFIPVAYF